MFDKEEIMNKTYWLLRKVAFWEHDFDIDIKNTLTKKAHRCIFGENAIEVNIGTCNRFMWLPKSIITLGWWIEVQSLQSLSGHRLIGVGVLIINLRQSWDCLSFVMGIPLPVSEYRPKFLDLNGVADHSELAHLGPYISSLFKKYFNKL